MKRIFTLLFCFFGLVIFSQEYKFDVTPEGGQKKTFNVLRSTAFGNQNPGTITKEVIKSDKFLACSNDLPTVDFAGNIAVVERGVCGFTEKVKNAQTKGATAVIVCNNQAGIIAMGGTDATITVPAFSMTQADCVELLISLNAGVKTQGTIRLATCGEDKVIPANTIWGAETGQGDFNGGFGNWTSSNPNFLQWRSNPRILGTFTDATVIMPTACNGYIGSSSDSLDNSGACISPCEMSITSPNISLQNISIGNLSVQFSQSVRQFTSEFYLLSSFDGGLTYPDTIPFNTSATISTNQALNNNIVSIPLCKAPKNATQIKFKFIYIGDYYYWAMDDFYLINNTKNDADVRVNDFLARAPTLIIPKGQSHTFAFLSDVQNVGASPATNVVLKAEILDPLDNVIYSQNNAYGTIGCFETVENIPFDKLHTQKFDEPGVYSIKYTISADTNIVSTNDAIEIPFIISDSTFANITRETPTNQFLRGARSFWNPTFWDANVGTTQTSLGNFYKVTAGKNKAVSKVRFGLDNTNTAMQGFVIVDLYRVFDENGDYILDPNDRVLLGTETLVVTNQTPNLRFIEVDIKDADGKPILLEDNSDYAVVIHTEGISGSASTPQVLSYNPRANEHLVYFIATLYGFVESDKPYYHSLISDATRLDIDKRSFSPWWTNIPSLGRIYPAVHFIEMDITNLATTSTEQFVADLNISMYPNPVENTINLTYNLEKSSSVIATEVMDYTGRILDKKSFNNSNASGVINYDVTNIPSGSYFLKIRLEDNSYTVLKFVKI